MCWTAPTPQANQKKHWSAIVEAVFCVLQFHRIAGSVHQPRERSSARERGNCMASNAQAQENIRAKQPNTVHEHVRHDENKRHPNRENPRASMFSNIVLMLKKSIRIDNGYVTERIALEGRAPIE